MTDLTQKHLDAIEKHLLVEHNTITESLDLSAKLSAIISLEFVVEELNKLSKKQCSMDGALTIKRVNQLQSKIKNLKEQ